MEDVRITFQGDGQYIYFYVNKTMVHVVEQNLLDAFKINSNRFDELLLCNLSLRVQPE